MKVNIFVLTLTYLMVVHECSDDKICTEIKSNRSACPENKTKPQPPNRTNTTERLATLRKIMTGLQVLLVTPEDEHQSVNVAPSDKRLDYISGFTGGEGSALITLNKAALWTDGRYHLQADAEMDCNWLLMREGNPDVPSKTEWLNQQFPHGAVIGADSKLVSADTWNDLEYELKKLNENFTLVETKLNLIDEIWSEHSHEKVKQAYTLDYYYNGKIWTQKVNEVRKELEKLKAEAMVVTAVDEVAWLLNIRGWDLPESGFLKSYVILSQTDTILYVDERKVKDNVTLFFEKHYPGELKFRSYNDIWLDLPVYSQTWSAILAPTLCSFNPGVSKKIFNLIPEEKRLSKPSPIIYLKAVKNPREIIGMKNAHVKDAVALCKFFHYFESRINAGEVWDELKVSREVHRFKSEQQSFVTESFKTITGFGAHGALPHYVPVPSTTSVIFKNSTLVLDTGGQYYDGTTDVTRTVHLGVPTKEQRQAYTRVLMGSIQLFSFIFPDNVNTSAIDVMARAPLWEIGYDYSHGTGHGIGAFLAVHEAPISIRYNSRARVPPTLLKPGYFTSNEPGYYLEGKFGIRLENTMEVVNKSKLKQQRGHSFLGFEAVSLVPYDTKLIDFSLLTYQHRRWLNNYNGEIRRVVGAELLRQNATDVFEWLCNNTKHIPDRVAFY